jgi:hypothetical protein
MKDLAYLSDDLSIQNGDLVLTSDEIQLLITDLNNQIRTFHYTWVHNFLFGSRIPQYINMPDEALKLVEIKNEIIRILKNNKRVAKDSWEIEIKKDGISIQFLPVCRSEPITLTINV